jgi:hypothetical protein
LCFILNGFFSADNWPQVLDDSLAKNDWGWSHRIDLDTLVDIMIDNLQPIYQAEKERAAAAAAL